MRAVRLPEDLVEVNNWLRARGELNLDQDLVPPQGFIEPGVACGFMITTNTSVAFLEHFVSNKDAKKEERAKALDEIAARLIKAGESSGIRVFMALSSHPNIINLCQKHNLKELTDLRTFGRKI